MSMRGLGLFLFSLAGFAADQGQISGSISDGQRAPVSGARLTATNTESKHAHAVTSGSDGNYRLSLPEGTYDVLVQSAAHQPFQQKVYITPGASNTVNIQLTAGGPPPARKSTKPPKL